jgi:hypothetical protein
VVNLMATRLCWYVPISIDLLKDFLPANFHRLQ